MHKMSLKCILQPNTWMKIPFRFKIGIHKWYLGQKEGVGYLCTLGFSFTFDLIVSLAQAKVEVER